MPESAAQKPIQEAVLLLERTANRLLVREIENNTHAEEIEESRRIISVIAHAAKQYDDEDRGKDTEILFYVSYHIAGAMLEKKVTTRWDLYDFWSSLYPPKPKSSWYILDTDKTAKLFHVTARELSIAAHSHGLAHIELKT